MGDEESNPYAAPGASSSHLVVPARDRTCDLLATSALVAGAVAIVAFAVYWVATPETTDMWFYATLGLMAVGLVLAVSSLVLSRHRHVRRGRAKAAVLLAVSPVLFVVAFYGLTFGSMWIWTKIATSFGVGY